MTSSEHAPAAAAPPSAPVTTGDDRVVDAIARRARDQDRAELDARRGSRVQRGCAALVAGSGAVTLGSAACGALYAVLTGAAPARMLTGVVVLALLAVPMTWLTWSWARGLPPLVVDTVESRRAARLAAVEADAARRR